MKRYLIYILLRCFPLSTIAMEEKDKIFLQHCASQSVQNLHQYNPILIEYNYVKNGQLLFKDIIRPKVDHTANIKEIEHLFNECLKNKIAFTNII